MRILLALSMALLCVAPALAADEPASVRAAADAAVAAAKHGDADELQDLAASEDPAAWLVLDELCLRGALGAARTLAEAGPKSARAGLVAYVERRRKEPLDPEARAAYAKAWQAHGRQDFETAARVLESIPALPPSALAVQVRRLRADVLREQGKAADAAESLGQAGLAARDIGWTHACLVHCYEAGTLAARNQDLAACERWWRPAYEAARTLGGERHRAEIGVRLAIVLSRRGQNAEALAINREVLPLFEKTGNKRAVATLRMNIGTSLIILGRLGEALETMTKARDALAAAGDARGVALVTGNMSAIYSKRGDYESALQMKRDALERQRALGMQAEANRLLSGIGDLYRQIGDYANAFAHYEQALAAHRKTDDKEGIGFTLGRMGLAHAHLGDREKAYALLAEGLAVLDAIGSSRYALHLRNDLASQYRRDGEYEKALTLQKEVLAAREAAHNVTGISDAHQTIAGTYGAMGRPAEGLPHAEKALELAKEAKNAASIAYAQIVQGDLFMRLGRYEEALRAVDLALAHAHEYGDHLLENAVYETHVEIGIASGNYAVAVAAAKDAAVALRRQFRNLGHEERARAGERWTKTLVLGVEAARRVNEAETAFDLLEASRAAALREALGGGTAIRAAAVPLELRREGAEARAAEAAAANRLRSAMERRARLGDIRALKKELVAAHARIESVAVKMERTAKAAAEVVQPSPSSLEACQRLLDRGRVLLSFTVQGEGASVLVVRPKSIRHLELGPSAAIRDACNLLHADRSGTIDDAAVASLRKLVIEPLGLKRSDRHLWVSPDGAMAYVPFALLVDDRDIAYVPSGSTAVQLAAQGAMRGEGVLALGDPAYDAKRSRRSPVGQLRSGFGLTRLPASGEEARAIGDVVLLGADATEPALADAVAKRKRWRAVHLACHGLVDPKRPSFCALALTPTEGTDGFLTALEVMGSRIPTDLVVLSACETGRGKVYDGEGLVGLTRAFMMAGAPRVLVSLWKVDDEATRALMEAFYAEWKRGKPAAAALRHAQDHVRNLEKVTIDAEASRKARRTVQKRTKPYADPRYWAGWVLWGLGD